MSDNSISFTDLSGPLRARALVGTYLQKWAFMEADLNEAIEIALGLDSLPGIIVCKNIQLRDKVYILKSIISLNNPGDRFQADIDALSKIADLATKERNLIAHEAFAADKEGDGVRFFVIKAKGKLSFPEARWSIAEFLQKFEILDDLGSVLRRVGERFNNKSPDLSGFSEEPINALAGLGSLYPQAHLPPDNPGLGLLIPIPQKEGETH